MLSGAAQALRRRRGSPRRRCSLDARGTCCSSPAVRIVTSLAVESKPMSGARDVVDDDRVQPLARACRARAPTRAAPCSAAKPTSVWSGRRRAASPASTSAVGSSSSVRRSRPGLLDLPFCGAGGTEVRDRRRHQQHVAGGELLLAARSAARPRSRPRSHSTPGGRGERDVGGHDASPRRRACEPPAPARSPCARRSGCRRSARCRSARACRRR